MSVAGRALLAERLAQLVPGRIVDARISNGWRTAAAAQQHPDDYAACVSADAGRGSPVFLIVTNGSSTGDIISGAKAAERCADRGTRHAVDDAAGSHARAVEPARLRRGWPEAVCLPSGERMCSGLHAQADKAGRNAPQQRKPPEEPQQEGRLQRLVAGQNRR